MMPYNLNEQNYKRVLILGSGLISEPCIDYLVKNKKNVIKVCSNNKAEGNQLIENLLKSNLDAADRLKFIELDLVVNKDELHTLVHWSDLVISLVPTILQIYVIRPCLEFKKNLLTTSYISDELKKINKKIKEKDLIFMFETGVNPGLDHIISSKIIREEEQAGNIIVGYESWVGAFPSPDSVDNPLLYKFSWDPKGALLALKNDAKQLINGKIVTISEKNLLTNYLVDKKFHPSLNLEGYYNGNSLKYKELYNLKHAKNVIRGTIRYQGFTFIIQCFKYLNLFSFDKIDDKIHNWREYLHRILKNPRIQDNIFEVRNKYLSKNVFDLLIIDSNTKISLSEKMFYFNLSLLSISYFEDRYIRKFGFENLFHRIFSVLIYLELYKEDNIVKFIT